MWEDMQNLQHSLQAAASQEGNSVAHASGAAVSIKQS
jgi:hypothetical protein